MTMIVRMERNRQCNNQGMLSPKVSECCGLRFGRKMGRPIALYRTTQVVCGIFA